MDPKTVLQTFRKRLEIDGSKITGLKDHLNDFNGLAKKPLGYRYTIPQWIVKQVQ